jgi:hypothetical protein
LVLEDLRIAEYPNNVIEKNLESFFPWTLTNPLMPMINASEDKLAPTTDCMMHLVFFFCPFAEEGSKTMVFNMKPNINPFIQKM